MGMGMQGGGGGGRREEDKGVKNRCDFCEKDAALFALWSARLSVPEGRCGIVPLTCMYFHTLLHAIHNMYRNVFYIL